MCDPKAEALERKAANNCPFKGISEEESGNRKANCLCTAHNLATPWHFSVGWKPFQAIPDQTRPEKAFIIVVMIIFVQQQ